MKSFRLYTKNDPEHRNISADDKMSRWLLDKHLIPKYTEISVFLIFLILVLALIELWRIELPYIVKQDLISYLKEDIGLYFVLFGVIVLGGGYSTYYAFNFNKIPPKPHAKVMVTFAVIMELIAAFTLFFSFTLTGVVGVILGLVNLLHAVGMFIALDVDRTVEEGLRPVHGKPIELIVGILFIIIIFLMMRYYFEMNLALVFSGAISYALIFNELISKPFVKR